MKYILLFLVLNFGGLYLGAFLMGNLDQNTWYLSLQRAPWTPPGWVFGAAWTLIMICYSVYLGIILKQIELRKKPNFWIAFSSSWILNLAWNPFFFRWHLVLIALLILISLVGSIMIISRFALKRNPRLILLLVPYFIWGILACSLNAYFYLYN